MVTILGPNWWDENHPLEFMPSLPELYNAMESYYVKQASYHLPKAYEITSTLLLEEEWNSLKVTLSAKLRSGGPWADLPYTLRAQWSVSKEFLWSGSSGAYQVRDRLMRELARALAKDLEFRKHMSEELGKNQNIYNNLLSSTYKTPPFQPLSESQSHPESHSSVPNSLSAIFASSEAAEVRIDCPVDGCGIKGFKVLWSVIHLNDSHKWTRHEIADWLETLDVDLALTPKGGE